MLSSSPASKTVLGGISGSPRNLLDTENLPFGGVASLTLRTYLCVGGVGALPAPDTTIHPLSRPQASPLRPLGASRPEGEALGLPARASPPLGGSDRPTQPAHRRPRSTRPLSDSFPPRTLLSWLSGCPSSLLPCCPGLWGLSPPSQGPRRPPEL